MANLEQIRKDADKMEKLIEAMLKDFVANHGNCDISLSNQMTYYENGFDDKKLMSVKVNVNVTI